MIDLKGKVAVVFGLANKRSIAWAIAQKLHADGWQLAITYQNERMAAEAADLIYHLLVVLEARGISLADVEAQLAERTRQRRYLIASLGEPSRRVRVNVLQQQGALERVQR